jgi:hypothetical protein
MESSQSKKNSCAILGVNRFRFMKLATLIIISVLTYATSCGQIINFQNKDFKGIVTISQTNGSVATYTLNLINTTSDNIFLLKTFTGFEPIQTNDIPSVYFDLTFPSGRDIYECKRCEFELYKLIPEDSLTLSVIKKGFQKVAEVIVTFDPILIENVKDQHLKKQIIKSDRQNNPRIGFKYYFNSGGAPLHPYMVRLKI